MLIPLLSYKDASHYSGVAALSRDNFDIGGELRWCMMRRGCSFRPLQTRSDGLRRWFTAVVDWYSSSSTWSSIRLAF